MRARLTEYLGVEWGPVRNGMAELAGIAVPVLAHFSKRRAAIIQATEGNGRTARQKAALETRPAKQEVDLQQLVADWRAAAAELGFDRTELDALLGRVGERRQLEDGALGQLARELAGERRLTERASTFDRRATSTPSPSAPPD